MRRISDFAEVLLCDFEYHYGTGGSSEGPPIPVCACALELRSGREYRLWTNELNRDRPPWAHGRDTLFVSFNASAELACFISLKWPLPPHILDLLVEYRQLRNGVLDKHAKRDLVSVLNRYQLPALEPPEKQKWQDLILTGRFDDEQQQGILRYCWEDVEALRRLLTAMLPEIPVDLERSLYRGRYTIAAAVAEYTGIPVDETLWCRFLECRGDVQREIIAGHPVYDGSIFRMECFTDWLDGQGLLEHWPRTPSGQVSAEDKTFRRFSHVPEVESLRQIRAVVEQLRKPSFVVRRGRNYFGILPFKAETSRNATVGCLFQAPVSLRGLIQPKPGTGLIYADYCQQEYYIAAYLANDPEMLQLYSEGDPYVAFGVMAGLMPATATKKSHPHEREIAKTVSLAVLYGQWIFSMARKLGISVNRAEDLLAAHRQRFPQVWRWSDERVRNAYLQRRTDTTWGWYLAVNSQTKKQTLRNFPVQGTGADIMRLAHILLFEAGIRVCSPVHDAFLIECSEAELEETTVEVCQLMTLAGKYVLGDNSILRADARVLRYPERLTEKRGEAMWTRIVDAVNRLSGPLPKISESSPIRPYS